MVAIPAQPPGLGVAGKQLWKAIHSQFVLEREPHKMEILTQACRVSDVIAELDREQMNQPRLVPGSRPRMLVINPLTDQARQQRILLTQLLTKLDLPADVGDSEADEKAAWRKARATKAARARWGDRTVG